MRTRFYADRIGMIMIFIVWIFTFIFMVMEHFSHVQLQISLIRKVPQIYYKEVVAEEVDYIADEGKMVVKKPKKKGGK